MRTSLYVRTSHTLRQQLEIFFLSSIVLCVKSDVQRCPVSQATGKWPTSGEGHGLLTRVLCFKHHFEVTNSRKMFVGKPMWQLNFFRNLVACDLWDYGAPLQWRNSLTEAPLSVKSLCFLALDSLPLYVWRRIPTLCGTRPDSVAPSRPFIQFHPTPGRTPRRGRPGWTAVSPWLAGTLPGPCACCQQSCFWARHPPGRPGRRQSSGRTERPSVPAG